MTMVEVSNDDRVGQSSAAEISAAVKGGAETARSVIEHTLARISSVNPRVNAFTDVTDVQALRAADEIDARRAAGQQLGALAGVPFAAKNLFDIAGLVTRAGSRINRDRPPARHDAALIRRLQAQDAILVGALNMGEYAYDFTGDNCHDGPSRNPHDLTRMTGGSSGGSGAAIAAGLVPIALGSDTNGSIRVPSSLCGIFGLEPTYGRLSRAGTFPFVSSFDHLGPFARTVGDLALAYDVMQGADGEDPMQAPRAVNLVASGLDRDEDVRIAVAGGFFRAKASPDVRAAIDRIARALGVTLDVDFPDIVRARAAATVITAAEGAALHAHRLRREPQNFGPAVRERLIAGLAIPAAWVESAQRFRRQFATGVADVFAHVDIVIAPATPCRAPLFGQQTFELDGETVPVRSGLGMFTQPISFIGLPVVAVPVWLDDGLPIGIQVIAAPRREDLALKIARRLERLGAVVAPVAKGFQ